MREAERDETAIRAIIAPFVMPSAQLIESYFNRLTEVNLKRSDVGIDGLGADQRLDGFINC